MHHWNAQMQHRMPCHCAAWSQCASWSGCNAVAQAVHPVTLAGRKSGTARAARGAAGARHARRAPVVRAGNTHQHLGSCPLAGAHIYTYMFVTWGHLR
jgi:hypothetical protein